MLVSLTRFLPETFLTLYDNLEFLIRIAVSAILGMIIGLERTKRQKEAGIRTHCIIACTAAAFMILSKYAFADVGDVDEARLAAQVVSGISFIGAGVIFHHDTGIKGLTTAAGMWATAAVGMSIGAGMYWVGLMETGVLVFIQIMFHKHPIGNDAKTLQEIHITMDDDPELANAFYLLLAAHDGEIEESDITRHNGLLSLRVLVRMKTTIEHDEALQFLSRHEGIRRLSV